ncbi:MAG TPA: ferritin-like domain-containing protein [Longimicrobiaceae bacterium]|nr:ferritin-like domain-containing protein [Longimicrobiaceae bacterium]
MELNELLTTATSRRDALRSLGKLGAGAALAGTPFAVLMKAKPAYAQSGTSVVDILNYALTLEYLEATFYTMGVAQSGLIPASDLPLFTAIRDDENAHVAFLKSQLGSQAVAKPTFDFTAGGMFDPFGDYATFKLLSQAFEDTGVRAYKGQAPNLIGNDTVLQAALQIHSIEARHASMVRQLNGLTGWIPLDQPEVPAAAQPVYAGEAQTTQLGVSIPSVSNISAEEASEAFDEPLDMDAVLAIAGPFIGS